ncbi:MAG: D-TA family PLP-dependent enzyme [Tannerellaceae bacterium]|jgi:D-serine deaminase-like pyridoxal phosphate-dependent protein|nr:D-TA family PLP-dependent enzyme [Tannerellaceae bacterium]
MEPVVYNANEIDSPALIVDREAVARNIDRLVELAGNVARLRPHVKTHKTPQIAQMMMSRGILKFKCATIAEAEMLAKAGAPDIMLAYQPVGPKVSRLLSLARQYPLARFSCLVDNEASVRQIAQAFASERLTARVAIDVNIGMNRTGLLPGQAPALAALIDSLDGITLVALHGYDGHIHSPSMADRAAAAAVSFAELNRALGSIPPRDPALVPIAGGTVTFTAHLQNEGVECSPGTFVLWDAGYASLMPELPFTYAAFVMSRVISVVNRRCICLDVGYKAIASEKPLPRIRLLNVPNAQPIAQSEEHLVVQVPDSSLYPAGTIIFGVPEHICPTVALYDKMHVVNNGIADETWEITARYR